MITAAEAHTMMPSSIKKKEEIEIILQEIEEKIKTAAENDKNGIGIDMPNYEYTIEKILSNEYGFNVEYGFDVEFHNKMIIKW